MPILSNVKEFQLIPKSIIWLAHTANNQATARGVSLYTLLMGGYSSVDASHKVALPDTDTSIQANAARDAVNDVANGGADPTGGARFWDGTDFIGWGLNSPNGTPQNKFEEYSHITIFSVIYNKYLANTLAKYKNGSVKYYGTSYSIPADVFKDSANWIPPHGTFMAFPFIPASFYIGFFSYATGATGRKLFATGAWGLSIFWRVD